MFSTCNELIFPRTSFDRPTRTSKIEKQHSGETSQSSKLYIQVFSEITKPTFANPINNFSNAVVMNLNNKFLNLSKVRKS